VLSQRDDSGDGHPLLTPNWDEGRPTGFLEVDRLLNSAPDYLGPTVRLMATRSIRWTAARQVAEDLSLRSNLAQVDVHRRQPGDKNVTADDLRQPMRGEIELLRRAASGSNDPLGPP